MWNKKRTILIFKKKNIFKQALEYGKQSSTGSKSRNILIPKAYVAASPSMTLLNPFPLCSQKQSLVVSDQRATRMALIKICLRELKFPTSS